MEELNLEGDLSYNKILIKILETVEGERERIETRSSRCEKFGRVDIHKMKLHGIMKNTS
jgi:hypothetical protein